MGHTKDSKAGDPLTKREIEVLDLLCEGRTNKSIARKLEISEHTAKYHINGILVKLDCATRVDAVVTTLKRREEKPMVRAEAVMDLLREENAYDVEYTCVFSMVGGPFKTHALYWKWDNDVKYGLMSSMSLVELYNGVKEAIKYRKEAAANAKKIK